MVSLHAHATPQNGPSWIAQMHEADTDYQYREDPSRALRALKTYRGLAEQSGSSDSEILWRLSMACYFVGLRLTPDPQIREALYFEGKTAALAGAKLNPDCAPCHFWGAVTLALYGKTRGVLKTLFVLPEIREHLHTSILLDPTLAGSGAYRTLALIEKNLPGLLGGSNQQAKKFLELAIEESPEEPLNYLVLAETLENQFKDPGAALATARAGLSHAPRELAHVESKEARSELQSLIARLKRD